MLSVSSPVDHLVVVIEEVLCNSSVGPVIETKNVKGVTLVLCNIYYFDVKLFVVFSQGEKICLIEAH